MLLSDIPASFFRVFLTIHGLLWGSFLNVVIYRLPREMSVVRPASHCPGCGVSIKPWQNIPVFSYLLLRGKAGCCGAPISVRYPLVELCAGILALSIFEVMRRGGAGAPPDMELWPFLAMYFVNLALVLGLLASIFIDFEHMILPDPITLGGAVLALAMAVIRSSTWPDPGIGWQESLAGAAVGFGVVYVPFILGYKLLRGRPGMGLGDAKLLLLAGAWFGWLGAIFALFAGAVQGSIAAAAIFLVRGKIDEPESVRADREELEKLAAEGDEEAKEILAEDPVGTAPEEGFAKARIAFGPFLILGCFEYLLLGPQILRWLAVWLGTGRGL